MAPIFGSSTTALQALRGADLAGKTALVTGANSGIGVETVRALAQQGAKVILTSRSLTAGRAVVESLQRTPLKGSLQLQQLDLADLESVESLAQQLCKEANLDILILNAGVGNCPQQFTKDNFELQIGTNHFGHFHLVTQLLKKLQQQKGPVRVVAVASMVHSYGGLDLDDLHFRRRPYGQLKAYSQSKLCNILFAKELAHRTKGTNIEAFSLHPGMIITNLTRHSPLLKAASWLGYLLMKSPQQGAATSVYAATAPELAGQSGAYLADCKVTLPSRQAQDAELAAKLWAVTEQQIEDPAARIS